MARHVDIICPETKMGDRLATSVHDFSPGVMTWSAHKGHAVEVTQSFDEVTTDGCDLVYIADGRGPEYIRTYPRV